MTASPPASHPQTALLAAHASGWIPAAADLCVRVHLEACAPCRQAVSTLESGEAGIVDALPDAPVAPEAIDALLAKLAATPVEAAAPVRASLGDVELPQAIAQARFGRRRFIRPGLWVAHLLDHRAEGWRTYVLRVPPGQRLPAHAHGGPELICVLAGAFDDDRRYAAGDFVEKSGGSEHSVTATPDGPCACLVATKGRLRSSGFGKLINAVASV